jgi:hypothetical protein
MYNTILLKYHGYIKQLHEHIYLGSTQVSQVYFFLNKIPHVYQAWLISCTAKKWRSPQVRLNLFTSKPHETWASQAHATHSQVSSKCTKYKLLSTSTIHQVCHPKHHHLFFPHTWMVSKNLTSKKEGNPPLRLEWCYLKKYWNTKVQLIQRHK